MEKRWYRLNYKKYDDMYETFGLIIAEKKFKTKEEMKTFIKEELNEKDVIVSIIEIQTKRLNIEDFK